MAFLIGIVLVFTGCAYTSIRRPAIKNMVYVPAGTFKMGSDRSDGKVGVDIGMDELPKHSVYVKGFYIDKYETSVAEYKEFLYATGHRPPLIWSDPYYLPNRLKDNYPVRDLSRDDADSYCKWRGKRLPVEKEWEKAARGTDGRKFPWGDIFDPELCNIRDPSKIENKEVIRPVDSFSGGASPYGAVNMCGNVAEWTDSWYEPYPGSELSRDRFGVKRFKVWRGGWFFDAVKPMSHRFPFLPTEDGTTVGIRCVKD